MEALISQLRERGVLVETGNSFLLDASHYPFEVPKSLDGIPVQMSFAGSIPIWADNVRYHLHVRLVGSRRWSMCEPPKGFNVPLILTRIMKQLSELKSAQARVEQSAHDKALTESRLTRLGETLEVSQESPLRLAQDNLRIEAVPDFPNDVQITVRTSHENAAKIAREFRVRSRKPRVV
jgi:hypothetical protein